MAGKQSREVLAKLHEGERVISADMARGRELDEAIGGTKLHGNNALTIKIGVDVSEALTGLKAVQREAKKAAQALREVESQAGGGLAHFTTKELSEELIRREGIREYVVPPHEHARIGWLTDGSTVDITGPARILVNVV